MTLSPPRVEGSVQITEREGRLDDYRQSWLRGRGAVVGASLCIAFGACESHPVTPTPGPDPVPVVSLLGMKPLQLYVDSLGATRQIDARAYSSTGGFLYRSAQIPERFTWSSSDTTVLTVDDRGWTTSHGWGTAVVTAASEGVSGQTRVIVRDAVRLAWSIENLGETLAGITIGTDGTIYVQSRTVLYAISPEGAVLWTVGTPSGSIASPAIGGDGTLYLGLLSGGALMPDLPGGLRAVRPDGTIKWELNDVGSIGSSPALASDGTIYVASSDRHVYAVDPEGEVQWAYESDGSFYRSSPAVANDGTIYVGGGDERLHAINPDGSSQWMYKARDPIRGSPVIDSNGTIYFGALDRRLYAVNADGTEHWALPLSVSISPSIGADGTIYVGGFGVSAIDPTGSVRWTYAPNGGPTTPVLGTDGTVYVSNTNGRVISALDADGQLLWDHPTGIREGGSPAIGLDGTIFATSIDGTLRALVETDVRNGGYDGSPWPQEGGNRANSARAGG